MITAPAFSLGTALTPKTTVELAVIIPTYNEEENIGAVLDEWLGVLRTLSDRFLILVINDGSRDRTASIVETIAAQNPEVILWKKENHGHGITCRMGYEQALAIGAPWIFQIDSDGQCDSRFFPELWANRETADVLYGIRVSRDDGILRTLTSWFCCWGTFLWTGRYLRDPNVPYRLMRCDALARALKRIPDDFHLYNVALTLALKRDSALRWQYRSIHFRNRPQGISSTNIPAVVRSGLRMLADLKRVQ